MGQANGLFGRYPCMPDDTLEIVLPSNDSTAEFARGVEVGMLWSHLQSSPLPVESIVHAENAEMVLSMADALDCDVRARELGDDLLLVTFA
jgi:hypothetical protein